MIFYQVVFGQSSVADVLKEHLKSATVLNIQPMLELVAALATDLQHEFFPHLQSIVSILETKISIRDSEVVKWVQKCLGHLLKVVFLFILSYKT